MACGLPAEKTGSNDTEPEKEETKASQNLKVTISVYEGLFSFVEIFVFSLCYGGDTLEIIEDALLDR